MHGRRVQHALDRHAGVGVDRQRLVAERLLDLEGGAVRAPVLVDRHRRADYRSGRSTPPGCAEVAAQSVSSARTAVMPARSSAVKSRSGSLSIRSANPSASENRISATASGSACRCRTPSRCADGEQLGDLFARAPHQPGVLGGDVLVAPREREQLEDERHEVGVLADRLLQVLRHQVDEVVGRLGRRELALEPLDAQLAVAAHGLDEQLLLGAEVVVQQAARDAGLARDVVEGRAGRAALGDAVAHRIDDALRLLPGERALGAPACCSDPSSAFARGGAAVASPALNGSRFAIRRWRRPAQASPARSSSCSRTPPRRRTAGRAPSSADPR